jgi:CRISPR-associated protein Cmr4
VCSTDPLVTLGKAQRLVLEDLDFGVQTSGAEDWCTWIGKKLYGDPEAPWRDEMKKRFAILDDKSFDYLSEYATEITAHIKIDHDTGTVTAGALWYQESLPAETVLYLLIQADRARDGSKKSAEELLDAIEGRHDVQFGGKAGAGQGLARLIPLGGGAA